MSGSRRPRERIRWALRTAALALFLRPGPAAADNSRARFLQIEEPQLLKLRLEDVQAGVDVEDSHETDSFRDSGQRSTYDRSYVTPSISMGVDGSVYHPNFLVFSVAGRAAYGSGHQDITTDTTTTHDDLQNLWNVRGDMSLLANKPWNAAAHGHYDRVYREYDFFTRSTVNTKGYGAETVYRTPRIYSALGYAHSDDETLDIGPRSSTRQDVAHWIAQEYRGLGNSSFNYTFTKSDYSALDTTNTSPSTEQTVTLSDGERFGRQQRMELQSAASYSHGDFESQPDDEYTANSSLFVEHRPNLSSEYDLSLNRYAIPDYHTDDVSGLAALRHRLYESLASTLTLNGSESRSDSGGQSGYSRTLGTGIAEDYTKRLGEDHRLLANAAIQVNNVDQSSIGRAVNERHVFPSPPSFESFLLNLPNVDENTIVVSDSGNIRQFVRGFDYEVFPNGSQTEIRRIAGGTIPEGATVLVTYQAAPGAAGGYQAWVEQFGLRLELWHDLWGLYGRMRNSSDNAPPDLYVLESQDYIVGTDWNWDRLRAGAEYEIYDADAAAYRSTRFFQSYWFRPDSASSVSVQFSQTYQDNVDANRREHDFRYTLRYQRALTRRLNLSMHAGLDQHRGPGVDQDLAVLRPEIGYHIGQTTLKASYDYEHNLYLNNEERNREEFLATLTRDF